jgi:cytochrome c553
MSTGPQRSGWRAAIGVCLLLTAALTARAATDDAAAANAAAVERGRMIYVEGLLPNGQTLAAKTEQGTSFSGRAAACIQCHRASGMGSVEGNVRIQPITGRYLFPEARDLTMANMDGIRGKTLNRSHAPYDDALLARALAKGVDASGRVLNAVMPRYALSTRDIADLRAYLAGLSTDYSPGASKDTIRFAVVVTPDVTPARRKVFLDMLQAAVVTKNSSTLPRKRYMTMAANFVTQTERRWDVAVWSLEGPPSTWAAQLEAKHRATPVFALLSGLAEGTWEPVQDFAAKEHLPIWFPSLAAPPKVPVDGALYFSRGVLLEADVLAARLGAAGDGPERAVVQIYANDTPGSQAAQRLKQAWRGAPGRLQDVVVNASDVASLREAAARAPADADLVLWLGATALKALDGLPASSPARRIYLSRSLMPTSEQPPAAVAPAVRWVYPYELPGARQANLAYLHSWLKLRNIPLVDEEMQSELFLALNLMTDTLQDMIDNLYRDYLVERTEDMLGKRESSKAEQENRDRRVLGRLARAAVDAEAPPAAGVMDAQDARGAQRRAFGVAESSGTSVYPRLALGPGQHFASKGAYIVRLDPATPGRLVADSDWIIP